MKIKLIIIYLFCFLFFFKITSATIVPDVNKDNKLGMEEVLYIFKTVSEILSFERHYYPLTKYFVFIQNDEIGVQNLISTLQTLNGLSDDFNNFNYLSFIFIPSGSFYMGSNIKELGRDDDEHFHKVYISKNFFIQTTEVTYLQWNRIMQPGNKLSSVNLHYPIQNISWIDANAFITIINNKSAIKNCRFSLPTEAQWEYCASAGSNNFTLNNCTFSLPSEDQLEYCTRVGHKINLDNLGWYLENSDIVSHIVAQKDPNPWGIYDMNGNVWEWCRDGYSEYPTDPFVELTDPIGNINSLERITRGGSYSSFARCCRSSYRFIRAQDKRSLGQGFRLTLSCTDSKKTSLSYAELITGTILLSEISEYSLDAKAGDIILFRMIFHGIDPFIVIYDDFAKKKICSKSITNSKFVIFNECKIERDGTYSILLSDYEGDDTGDYSFYLQKLNSNSSMTINYGDSITGTISLSVEMDEYTFEGKEGDIIYSQMIFHQNNLDPTIQIFDSDGNKICYSETDNGLYERKKAQLSNCMLQRNGTYSIFLSENGGDDIGDYSFTFNVIIDDLKKPIADEEGVCFIQSNYINFFNFFSLLD